MTFTPVPKGPKRLPKPRKEIKRSATTKRGRPTLQRSGKPRAVNPVAKAKRNAKFKKYLGSAAWKKLRLAVFKRDGFRCTKVLTNPAQSGGWSYVSTFSERCPNQGESRTGRGLVADHITYARFGRENLDDIRTLCAACNRRETVEKRANWRR